MARNKQNDTCSTLSPVPVVRDAGSLVMTHFRPVEQCLLKTYVEFSMMNNHHHSNSLLRSWQASALPTTQERGGIKAMQACQSSLK